MLDAMEQFDIGGNPVIFSLKYVTYNRKFHHKVSKYQSQGLSLNEAIKNVIRSLSEKETIGKIVHLERVCLARNMKQLSNTAAAREPIVTARKHIPDKRLRSSIRRLFLVDELKIKNAYLRLIIEFNGHPVVY